MADLTDPILPTEQKFLNSTIIGFSINQQYNEQSSNLNIRLVEDPNDGDDFLLKEENTNNINGQMMGTPQLFQYGNFSYAGILVSYDEDRSIESYPTYNVVLASPLRLLSSVQVGLDGYLGPGNDSIFNSAPQSDGTFQVSNFLNVYGFLESMGFGDSNKNDVGIPWADAPGVTGIKTALETLSRMPPPAGFSHNLYYGAYITYKNNYYQLDLSDLPIPPSYYRLGGAVSMSLMELISKFCQDAGVDYITNLTLGQGNGPHTISFQTVPRVLQPTLGQVSEFIASQDNISTVTHGQEVRDDITQALLVGGAVNFLQPLFNSQTNTNIITPFFGFDINGNPIIGAKPDGTQFADDDYAMNLNAAVIADIIGELNSILTPDQMTSLSYPCTILEMRCALISYDMWQLYVQAQKPQLANVLRLYGAWDVTLKVPGGIPDLPIQNRNQLAEFMIDMLNDTFGFALQANEARLASDHFPAVAQKLYAFVKGQADTYYGKQFLVQLPFDIQIKLIPQTTMVVLSDELSEAGYIPEDGNTLGLNYTNENFFLDDTGRFFPFIRFEYTNNFNSIYTLNASVFPDGSPISSRVVYTDLSEIDTNQGVVQGGLFPSNPYLNGNPTIQTFIKVSQGVASPLSVNGRVVGGSPIFFVPLGYGGGVTAATVVTIEKAIWAQGDDITGYYPDLIALMHGIQQDYSPLEDPGWAQFQSMLVTPSVPTKLEIHPPAIYPDAVAVALKSNQYLYGPWGKFNTNGKLEYEQDEGLTPWDCGDYTTMNQVAQAKLNQIAMGNQVLERAQIMEPGLPSYNLAQTLFQDGPLINAVNCSIGIDGIKTTYTLETFVNRIAAFSIENADLLKRFGKIYQQLRRTIRQQVLETNRLNTDFETQYAGFMYGTTYALSDHSPHGMMAGYLGYSDATQTYVPMVFSETNQESLKGLMDQDGDIFPIAAAMGMEGLYRPYTNNVNNESLPWYFSPDPVYTGLVNTNITSVQLNPFVSGCDLNWVLTGDSYSRMSSRLYPGDVDFTNLKAFALRGPMLLQGWGFDFLGNPIPNSGTPGAPTGQIYPLTSYNSTFEDSYLVNSVDWSTGPIDLRWNKFDATWISPGMVIPGMISGANINPGTQGIMAIIVNNQLTNESMHIFNNYVDMTAIAQTGYRCHAGYDLLSKRWCLISLACNYTGY